MSKVTSWDGIHYLGYVYPDNPTWAYMLKNGGVRVRVKVWPEGAPDPSTVPHAGERVENTTDTGVVISGIPERGHEFKNRNRWGLRVRRDHGEVRKTLWFLDRTHRIPDAPTIEIGGNRYRESDVIARRAELEKV